MKMNSWICSLRKFNLAKKFNLCFRHIDDLICFNHKSLKCYLKHIYPKELNIEETTLNESEAHYLDLCFHIKDSGDKRDSSGFPIVNFPFLTSNIPSSPAYGVYVLQLIHCTRCSTFYSDFAIRHSALASKLVRQGYQIPRLISTFKKFYAKYQDLLV